MSVARHLDVVLPDDPRAAAQAPPHVSFHAFMDRALFDPEVGYYAAGRVAFGEGRDYWTFAQRMSPAFGECVALRVLDLWRVLAPQRPVNAPFRVVEVGGGEGQLLRDIHATLRARARQGDADAEAALSALELVAIDRSEALLGTQRDTQAAAGATVRHVAGSADTLDVALPGPFYGVVLANELLDQLSVDVVRLAPGGSVERLEVLPWVGGGLGDLARPRPESVSEGVAPDLAPLAPDRLPELLRRLHDTPELAAAFAARRGVAWTGRWARWDHATGAAYARHCAPEVAAQAALGRSAVTAPLLRALPAVVASLGRLLGRGAGAFLTVDYGGPTRHLLDPDSRFASVRTYSRDVDGDAHGRERPDDPFAAPGAQDITSDVDFGWAASLAGDAGLELGFYGHQGCLEHGVDLWDADHRAAMIAARRAEGLRGMNAGMAAWELVRDFREGGGFHLWVATTPGLESALEHLEGADPVDGGRRVLADTDLDAAAAAVERRLVAAGESPEDAAALAQRGREALHPGGSVVDDLVDVGLYRWRSAFLDALEEVAA